MRRPAARQCSAVATLGRRKLRRLTLPLVLRDRFARKHDRLISRRRSVIVIAADAGGRRWPLESRIRPAASRRSPRLKRSLDLAVRCDSSVRLRFTRIHYVIHCGLAALRSNFGCAPDGLVPRLRSRPDVRAGVAVRENRANCPRRCPSASEEAASGSSPSPASALGFGRLPFAQPLDRPLPARSADAPPPPDDSLGSLHPGLRPAVPDP